MKTETKTGGMYDFRKSSDAPKKLHRMIITKSDNGGREVEHHFKTGPENFMYGGEAKHSFGPGQSKEFMAHVQKHMAMEEAGESKAEKKAESKGKGGTAAAEQEEAEQTADNLKK